MIPIESLLTLFGVGVPRWMGIWEDMVDTGGISGGLPIWVMHNLGSLSENLFSFLQGKKDLAKLLTVIPGRLIGKENISSEGEISLL